MRTRVISACLLIPAIATSQPAPPLQDPWSFHRGLTFEANLGVGFVRSYEKFMGGFSNRSVVDDGDVSLAGPDLGIGVWIHPRLAISLRIAGVQIRNNIVHAFAGPTLQYWAGPHFWVGGGAGLSLEDWVDRNPTGCEVGDCGTTSGFGFDLRTGYSFGLGGPHAFNLSIESNTGFYGQDVRGPATEHNRAISFAILVGYQYL
jgi:hypothetical protein